MSVIHVCVVLVMCILFFCFFFFKQKTAYEIGTGDWSSDVCSSDLAAPPLFILTISLCGSAAAFCTAHFLLRQRPRFSH